MDKSQNEKLVNKILSSIPANIKAVNFLMDKLKLSKDSVYRRLSSKKSFSFDEIVTLATSLGFSLDEFIKTKDGPISVGFIKNTKPDSKLENLIKDELNYFTALAIKLQEAKRSELIITADRLFVAIANLYEHIFKFSYYKWSHQIREISINFPLSEFTVSQEISDLREKHNKVGQDTPNITFIIDPNFYLNTIRDIQYFYKRNLISKDELMLLQNELRGYVFSGWDSTNTSTSHFTPNFNSFYSMQCIDSNSAYAMYDDVAESNIWIYHQGPIRTNNPLACDMHKKWTDSLKRYSTLMSGSNELFYSEFIQNQLSYIDNMDNTMY